MIDSLRDASSGVLCVSLILAHIEKLREWKTRHGRAENNESNECVGNAFLFPGILTLPILMANPPLDPEDSINSGSIVYIVVIIHHAVQAQFTQALMTVSWPRT